MLFKNLKGKGKETAYYTFIRYPQIIHYVDLLFCLVILPLIILLVPVDKWIKTNLFLSELWFYIYTYFILLIEKLIFPRSF